MRSVLTRSIWSQLLIVLAIIVAIHWNLLFDSNGYVSWANYYVPYTNSQYSTYASPPWTWSPFPFMGNVNTFPFSLYISYWSSTGPSVLFASFLGAATVAKTYVIVSSLFLGAAFLLLLRSLVRNYWGQLAGVGLMVAGPFQLQLYGSGDYTLFPSVAFVFLAIYFLWWAFERQSTRWIFFPLSTVSLLLSLSFLQGFILGLLLYGAFLVFFSLSLVPGSLKLRLASLGKMALRLLVLPLLLAPFILPLLSPPVNVSPSGAYALPLSNFNGFTTNPLAVFLTTGYVSGSGPNPPNFLAYGMVSFVGGSTLALVWVAFAVCLVIVVWSGVLILRDRRGYFLLIIAVAGSLLGSGPYGPLGGLNTYLYLHLIGYQNLNASYFWDWIIVVPALAVALGVLVERLVEQARAEGPPNPRTREAPAQPAGMAAPERIGPLVRGHGTLAIRVAGITVAVLVVVAVILPYAVNAQNGPLGIHTNEYPADYVQIPGLLEHLIGSSYAGVALFNPDLSWFLFNSTHSVPNAFFYFPTVRTSGLPFYAVPPYPSNFYYYWVYDEFYSNATRYVGELLAAAGIEYLLVFYGAQSASYYPYFLEFSYGKNASQLMNYQSDIVPIVSAKDFAIYRNLYYSNVAVSLSNLSVVAGDYAELNAMAYAGVNLTNQGLVFPTDIPSGSCDQYMDHVDRIYAASVNALYGLALQCTASSSTNPLTYIPTGLGPSQGWSSSYQGTAYQTLIVGAWPASLALTDGGPYSIDVPYNAESCSAACSLWLPVLFSGNGGLLSFQLGNSEWTANTIEGWQGLNNAMIWVQLPLTPVQGVGTLSITSISGTNAVGTIYVASSTAVTHWLQNATDTRALMLMTAGSLLELPSSTAPGQGSGYCQLPSDAALDNQSLCVWAVGAAPVKLNLTLPSLSSGWLSMLVRALGGVALLSGSPPSRIFGFDTSDYNAANLSMTWIRIPIDASELTSNGVLPLQVANGSMDLSEVTFTPFGTYGQAAPVIPGPNLTLRSEYYTSAVTKFNISVTNVSPVESVIAGAIQFRNTIYTEGLANAVFSGSPRGTAGLAIQYNVSPGLLVGANGIVLGGNSTAGSDTYGPSLANDLTRSSSSVYLSFLSYQGPANASVTFTIRLEFANMPLESNLTDVDPGPNWGVTVGTQGYTLEGGPDTLVLVRVPYFPDLSPTGKELTLAGALGSIDSLVWNPSNSTRVNVVPVTNSELQIGYAVLFGSLAGWMVVEYLWNRRKRSLVAASSDSELPPVQKG